MCTESQNPGVRVLLLVEKRVPGSTLYLYLQKWINNFSRHLKQKIK